MSRSTRVVPYWVYAVVIAVAALVMPIGSVAAGPAPAAHAAAEEDRVLALVNAHRVNASLPQLSRDATIEAAAEEWAAWMGTLENPLTHSSREWRASRMPPGWNANGENIAYGYRTADEVMDGWMNSPGHRANILSGSFTRIGIGYVNTAKGAMWVQIFGGYAGDTAPQPQPLPLGPTPTPTIGGLAEVGGTLTVSTGTWGPGQVSLAYQWNVSNQPVPGATGTTFLPDQTTVGKQVSVTVTGSRPGYVTASMTSGSTPQVTTPFAVARVSGPDRYSVSVAIAQQGFPDRASVVYLATGANYPDALSAGPAAAVQNAPLLLTRSDSVPPAVDAEIQSLAPQRIVIVGGTASISQAVEDRMRQLAPEVVRLSGPDRFAASRAIVDYAFTAPGAARAYVATGLNFPDALAAGGAGGHTKSPVLLVNGTAGGTDAPTNATLTGLRVQRITIAGGPNSVSGGVQTSLQMVAPVERISGGNRYEAAANINLAAYTSATKAYLATGTTFPDALSGSALSGREGAPLFVVPTDCVPRQVIGALRSLGVSDVVLIGGPNSMNAAVQNLTACGW
ncbi:cell wall-binding repeat-containing protein [Herbiconiux sp.]|uniref:cell wall-binding repeat-containing protein n=1 Tax=Herbiconiux sp. TaxID=1871186 RepID=UPI0025B82F57|nr:cell wall-binding repeat-containing protein [Herbiconiux sp.]